MGGGGGGTTTTTSGDPMMAMAQMMMYQGQMNMAQEQWGWAKEQYQIAKDLYLPYEQDLVKANQAMLPLQSEYQKQFLTTATSDLVKDNEMKDLLREQQKQEISNSAPVAEAFYKAALEGVDPDYAGVMGKAASTVEQSYAGAADETRRSFARQGLGAESGAAQTAMAQMGMNKAASKALAQTGAYQSEKARVEDTNFARLQAGMGARGSATGLTGSGSAGLMGGSVQGVDPNAKYGLAGQYAGIANQGMGMAASTLGNLANQYSTETTSGGGGGGGWGSVAGAGLGLAGSLLTKFLP